MGISKRMKVEGFFFPAHRLGRSKGKWGGNNIKVCIIATVGDQRRRMSRGNQLDSPHLNGNDSGRQSRLLRLIASRMCCTCATFLFSFIATTIRQSYIYTKTVQLDVITSFSKSFLVSMGIRVPNRMRISTECYSLAVARCFFFYSFPIPPTL